MIFNIALYGYQIKFPLFLGTSTNVPEDTSFWKSGVGLTLGIVSATNILTYLAFMNYKKLKHSEKYTSWDVSFRKFLDRYAEYKEKEDRLVQELNFQNLGDLVIMDALVGHKTHIKQIIRGKSEMKDPPRSAEEFRACQVLRVTYAIQSLVNNGVLVINKHILENHDSIFNPRKTYGDAALYIHFRYRGYEKKVLHIYSAKQNMIPEVPAHPDVVEITDYELNLPNDVLHG